MSLDPAAMSPGDLVATMPFAVHTGVEITAASRDEVVGHLDWSEARTTLGGGFHGGALMTLADSLGAVAAFLHLPAGAGTATVSSSTVLLKAARQGRVTGRSRAISIGRRFITVQTDLSDEEGRAIATTTQVQAVLA